MVRTISTHWFPDYLQNELTAGTVALLRAWLAEACRISGSYFSATSLAESLAVYVAQSMDEEDLGKAPMDSPPLPTPAEVAKAAAFLPAHLAVRLTGDCAREPEPEEAAQ